MLQRPALSRIGVVVALLMVGLCIALFLSAVGRIREAAALSTCKNNLKQLGIAVHNYSSANRDRLPPLADQGEGAISGNGLPSIFATLGPYIEACPRYYRPDRAPADYYAHSSIAFSYKDKFGTLGTLQGGVANQIWRAFIDPSDATADRLRDVPITLPDGTTDYYATGSYAANGLVPWGTGWLPASSPNVILFSERPQVCRPATGDSIYNLWGLGVYSPHMPAFAALSPTDPPGLWSTNQAAPVVPVSDREHPIPIRFGRRDAAPESADFLTPVQILGRGRPCDPRLPGSPHPAGMQVAMADGSTRVFAPDTEPWVFWTACQPGDSMSRKPIASLR